MIQLQRWWGKFGLCCGTRAKGLYFLDGMSERVDLELVLLDGMLGRVDLELVLLDGCHFSSLQEVGEVSLEKTASPEQIWSFMLMPLYRGATGLFLNMDHHFNIIGTKYRCGYQNMDHIFVIVQRIHFSY